MKDSIKKMKYLETLDEHKFFKSYFLNFADNSKFSFKSFKMKFFRFVKF